MPPEPTPTATRRIPQLDLSRQYQQIRGEVLAALERVCDSQQFVMGAEVVEFEREAASFCGAAEGVGCASGTDAIWLGLAGCGVGPGDSVIAPAFTFFATASAVTRAGGRPVLMDIDPRTLNLDPAAVERRLVEGPPRKLKAILPVHLYGQCADMDAFTRIAREQRIAMVEDAAQAMGAAWRGQRAGSLGTAAAFSFYPSKNLSAYGDGGLLTTSVDEVAERTRTLRSHGSRQRYFHDEIGWNSRLDSLQAAVLRVKLRHLEHWNRARQQRAARYDELLMGAGLCARRDTAVTEVSPSRPIALPVTAPEAYHVFHQYVVRAHRRDELRAHLATRGVGAEIYYPLPLHLQKAFLYLGYREGDLPESERAAREVLALPMFPELTEEEQRYVADAIAEFYR